MEDNCCGLNASDIDMSDTELRVSAWLLLVGGSLAVFGAFLPPYRQWYAPLEEGLRAIHGNPTGWYAIHTGFLSGTWVCAAGLAMLAFAVRDRAESAWAVAIAVVYLLSAACWTVNIAYRISVWNWTADRFVATGIVPAEFEAWRRFAGVTFALFSAGAYLTVAGLGSLCLASGLIPRTLSLIFVGWGLSAGFVVGYNVPFIAYVPFIIFGAVILRR